MTTTTRTSRLAWLVVLAALLAAGVGLAFAPGASAAQANVLEFTAPKVHSWTVPAGVTTAQFSVYGARGGAANNTFGARGGLGGAVEAAFTVVPGQTYTFVVGVPGEDRAYSQAAGLGGYGGGGNGGACNPGPCVPGGGGGGTSQVLLGTTTLLVAGGGGGAGSTGHGGNGGGPTGQFGQGGSVPPALGGSQTAGGAAGVHITGDSFGATAGQPYNGGTGGTRDGTEYTGGGGGGGWYGGGGGAIAGGGGGSGYAAPNANNVTWDVADGIASQVVVRYGTPEVPDWLYDSPPSFARVGWNYSYMFWAPAFPTPSYTVTSGSLPPGLQLMPYGTLSGKATTPGTYDFTVTARNLGGSAALPVRIVVRPPLAAPAFAPTTVPGAMVDRSFSHRFAATGEPVPTVTVSAGSLPDGLTLTADGTLSGKPTTAGPFDFTLRAASSEGAATLPVHLDVAPATTVPLFGADEPPAGTVGEAYSYRLPVSGDPAPVVGVVNGDLPDGLSLATDGTLSGTPRSAGRSLFTIEARNDAGSASRDVVLTVEEAPVAPSFGPAAPPAGVVATPYSYRFVASGLPTPVVSLAAGSLPPGLSLADDGTLSGTPTGAGTYGFVLRATGFGTPALLSTQASVTAPTPPPPPPPPPPAPPVLHIWGAINPEGQSGTTTLTFVVRLSRPSATPVRVDWSTSNLTAVAPTDYAAASGTLVIPAGATSSSVKVTAKGDRTREASETFRVTLARPVGATIGTGVGVGIIANDD